MHTDSVPPLHLPSAERPYWLDRTGERLPLIYLAWGKRVFGREPVPALTHEGWVYVVILSGAPTILYGSSKRVLKAGRACVIDPQCSFGWEDPSQCECRFLLWMWRTRPHKELAITGARDLHPYLLTQTFLNELERLHEACRREVRAPDSHTPRSLHHYQQLTDIQLIRAARSGEDEDQDALRIELARQWMEAHLEARRPIEKICTYLDVSKSTLHRLFRNHGKLSPAEFYLQLKMTKAREWLAQPDKSIKWIAYSLGYRHAGDFSRAFRRFYGRNPESHRQELLSARKG